MRRSQLALFGLALLGWAGAVRAHLAGLVTTDEAARTRWRLSRNRWLLLSSVSMNTVVVRSVYRYLKLRERGRDEPRGRTRLLAARSRQYADR